MNTPKLNHLAAAMAGVPSDAFKAEESLPAVVTDVLGTTADWFVATGQMPEAATPDPRQAAFYVGMQLEELAEKLTLILGSDTSLVTVMETAARNFKEGTMDKAVASALLSHPVTLLDADMDLIWVSIGGARAQGADVIGAYSAVNHANWDKRNPDTQQFDRHPVTGKVIKRAGWQEADLTPYVHDSLANKR
jgi:predicted HAD superfamily Cof-like phosphohydrolase